MLQDKSFGSSTTSPPRASFSADRIGLGPIRSAFSSQSFALPTTSERQHSDRSLDSHLPSLAAASSDPTMFGADFRPQPTILIRRLPRNIGNDALTSMLLFAGDLINTEIIRSPYVEDNDKYATAIARFRTSAGAHEAQAKLHGKSNTSKETTMIVEVHGANSFERRATIDAMVPRQESGSTSSSSSHGGPPGRSRYGSTFQSSDKISPPLPTPSSVGSGNEFPISDPNNIQSLFSPTSPLTNGFERNRVSGKSVINNDDADDETGELLKDPLAYAKSGQQARRSSHAQVPVSRFGSLSLSTGTNGNNNNHNNFASPSANHLSTPRGSQALQTPRSPTNITNMHAANAFNMPVTRHQYPPVNPADQNPPCNTLYVGNLPIETSEDELKAIFSRQRGYKRLCFRTKQNGPMCFVEFEDTTFASQALNDLYGFPLHNSVKGGIRLSFSKNPLGVRSGQTNGATTNGAYPHHSSLGAPNYSNGANGNGNPSNFTAVSGPPPGFSTPPGFNANHNYLRSTSEQQALGAMMFNDPFSMSGAPSQQNFSEQLGPRNLSGGLPPNMSGKYGRDSRGSISNYMFGR